MPVMKSIIADPAVPLYLGEADRPQPGADEVLIRVRAAGVNRADLLQHAGQYPPPKGSSPIIGMEVAGDIVALGENVSELTIGDRVCALISGGGYAQYAKAHHGAIFPIPDNLDYGHAASLPETMMTVWTNVFERCQLRSGEILLVHGGSSGIGVSAIQMAKSCGAKVYITAGSAEKCIACRELGADLALNYKEEDFEAAIIQAGGVDVILDMVGGEYMQKNINCLSIAGRLVNIAFMQGAKVEINMLPVMLKRLSLNATTLRIRSDKEKMHIRDAVKARFWPDIATGKIKPVIDSVFDLADASQAHQKMKSSNHIGKIILRV